MNPAVKIKKTPMPGCTLDKSNQNLLRFGSRWASSSATWCEELTHWKRPCWERLKAGGEGDDRGWDGWMASSTRWTWVWTSSRSWWWTEKSGVLQSTGLQRVGHNWVTELNWDPEDSIFQSFPGDSSVPPGLRPVVCNDLKRKTG